MKAFQLHHPKPIEDEPLREAELPRPEAGPGQLLIQVKACGVCHTDLHTVEGEIVPPRYPVTPGHQVVGVVDGVGEGVSTWRVGDRVGIPWLGHTCGTCSFCQRKMENLCDSPEFTGYTIDGGFAEYTVSDERFCFPIPPSYSEPRAAPLLCAGLIGYRSLVMAGEGERIGLYGFGAAAHIIIQVAIHQGRTVYAFTRPGDRKGQSFALDLGAKWAGDSDTAPPEKMDAAIIFAPVGSLVPHALESVTKGGVVVCAGIHMSDIPKFPYHILWGERVVRSVANLTRKDGEEFMNIASNLKIQTSVYEYPLYRANKAIQDVKSGKLNGAAVLVIP